MGYFNVPSYVLSRLSFLLTHLVFAYWLNFMLNDPFHLGTNTLDSRDIQPPDQCRPFIQDNFIFDLLLFGSFWLQHSIMARKKFKEIVGLWQHPAERPIFAISAVSMWFVTLYFWRPISDCTRWDPFAVPLWMWAVSVPVIALCSLLIVGFLWSLPDHVFGTARYQYKQGEFQHSGGIIRGFPYGLVRHPAATGFIWIYWTLPAFTINHIFLSSMWSVFIVVGTLVFEEGGLRGNDEFGKSYAKYAKEVAAFYPKPSAITAMFSSDKKDNKHH